ncbi:MAG: electron transfer flavoprotein subunit alpha/FixB family protein [Erysipelotrichaceae bacterium]
MKTKDIYVFAEQRDHQIDDVVYELLSESRKLTRSIKDLDFKVVAVLLGHQIGDLAPSLFHHGADRVIVCDAPELAHYSTMPYADALSDVVTKYHPDALLIGATVVGRDLAPRIAARIDTGLTADATKIEIDPTGEHPSELWITRPAFGGNLFGTIVCPNHRPQMATIRPKVLDADFYDEKNSGEIIEHPVKFKDKDKVTFIERILKEEHGVNIAKAHIIFSGGRGMMGHFDLLEKCAKQVGGVVAASRGAVDQGAAPKEVQVGQTGKTVRPTLYIACGISGAVQHTAGMDKSEYIIAINKDPQAAIFSIANLGIVGDAVEILPYLAQEIQKLQSHHE